MAEPRFDENEVNAIFAEAARAETLPAKPATSRGGMTLAEIQQIGQEAGLSPVAIANAAAALRSQGQRMPAAKFLGIPVGVAYAAPLQRPLTDEEWGEFVAQLRSTFNAGGTLQGTGNFREWRNGNLRISAGPATGGYRVDMRSAKGSARSLMTVGGAMGLTVGGFAAVGALTGGMSPGELNDVLPVLVLSAGAFGTGLLQVRSWARRRREQFEALATHLWHLTSRNPDS